jgi:hypothetical protein
MSDDSKKEVLNSWVPAHPSSLSYGMLCDIEERAWGKLKFMALLEHEIDIATGRRQADGHVRISVFAEGLLALTVEGTGERVPTLLLTIEQAQKLQLALADLIPQAERGGAKGSSAEAWDGSERRTRGR